MTTPELLPLPADTSSFPKYLAENKDKPIRELLRPYFDHENRIRGLFAQDPQNPVLANCHLGLVPVYAGHEENIKARARDLNSESEEDKGKYIMPICERLREKDGEEVIVDFERFKKNFRIFTESALENLDWNNIVAAGSGVLTPLLAIPEEDQRSHKTLREYYGMLSTEHSSRIEERFVDLFIYSLDQAAAFKKLEHIASTFRDNIIWEMTCIRTKDALILFSKAPYRPIRIRLRLYSSISQILHYSPEFKVECACVAYDGKQIYTTPRGIVSWMSQSNMVNVDQLDLLGKYEESLHKYWFHDFEIFYENLQRNSIDPSIYKFAISRLHGLAKLLVYESIALDRLGSFRRGSVEDLEVPEWEVLIEFRGGVSSTAFEDPKRVIAIAETCVYNQDFKLNGPKGYAQRNRVAYLHRHPAFVGSYKYVKGDCCGDCPIPQTADEIALQIEDDEHYIRGDISFLEVPAYPNPEVEEIWAEGAYARAEDEIFHQAIAELDAAAVRDLIQSWSGDGLRKNINRRGYTGRTPLQLAVMSSSPEIVDILISSGARLTVRLSDGRNSLHLAAARGDPEIIKLLLLKSDQNEELKMEKEDREREEKLAARRIAQTEPSDVETEDFVEMEYDEDEDIEVVSTVHGATSVSVHTGASSFVEVTRKTDDPGNDEIENIDAIDDVLEINMADKTYNMAPLHYAIIHDNRDAVTMLVSEFGADILRPIISDPKGKIFGERDPGIPALTLVRYISQKDRREDMLRTLLRLGASASQLDTRGIPVILRMVQLCDADCLRIVLEEDSASAVLSAEYSVTSVSRGTNNHVVGNALTTAICQRDEAKAFLLLEKGVSPKLTTRHPPGVRMFPYRAKDPGENENWARQPAEIAIREGMPEVFVKCVELGVDPSGYTYESCRVLGKSHLPQWDMTYLDLFRLKIDEFEKALRKLPKPTVSIRPGIAEGTYEYWLASRLASRENEEREQDSIRKLQSGYLYDEEAYRLERTRLESLKARYEELANWIISMGAQTYQERAGGTVNNSNRNLGQPSDVNPSARLDNSGGQKDYGAEMEDLLAEIYPSYEYSGVTENNMKAKYNRIFQAAWDGDQKALEKEFLTAALNEVPKVETQNELGDTIFSIAKHRDHPKEFIYFIHNIANSQIFKFEIESGKWNELSTGYTQNYLSKILDAIILSPTEDYHFEQGDHIFRDKGIDIKALEYAFKVYGPSSITSNEMDFPETEEMGIEESTSEPKASTYLGLSIDGKKRKVKNPNGGRPAKLLEKYDPIHGQFRNPISLYAAYHGLIEVLEWLETDGPEQAFREYQMLLENMENLEPEDEEFQSQRENVNPYEKNERQYRSHFLKILQSADTKTIKRWLGTTHPLLPHAVALNLLLGQGKTDREKVEWHTNIFKFVISRLGPDSINSAKNSAQLPPIFVAASIRNKWAMEALLNLGANLHATDHSGRELNIVHYIFDIEGRSQAGVYHDADCYGRIKGCIDLLPDDFKQWAFTNKKTKPFDELNPNCVIPTAMAAILYPEAIDLNSRNAKGDLPLHSTVKCGTLTELQLLLEISAPQQILMEDVEGMTVADIVDELFYRKVISNMMPDLSRIPDHYESRDAGRPHSKRQPLAASKRARENPIGVAYKRHSRVRIEDWGMNKTDLDFKSGDKMVHKVYKEAVGKVGKRRILVSLGEVNRVTNLERECRMNSTYIRHKSPDMNMQDIIREWAPGRSPSPGKRSGWCCH
ncbi:hypothetical protein TWF481_007663 [Arthrobotrys musiformis]|uniref:Ankyrin repeat protein n=1 Tax=Arthrobotrys musiformis TaxID=47236 RepID=A0AAV9WC75_9PEZI